MKKHLLAGTLAVALMCQSLAFLSAGGTETEAVSEPVADRGPETDGDGPFPETENEFLSDSLSRLDDLIGSTRGYSEYARAVLEQIQGFDLEKLDKSLDELDKNLEAAQALVKSEEFQSLLSYQEFRDLVNIILREMSEFVFEDPELSMKICLSLGMDEEVAKLILVIIEAARTSEIDNLGLLESGKTEELTEEFMEILSDPEIIGQARDLLARLQG